MIDQRAERWRSVGLTPEEGAVIAERLGREPNDLELGLCGVMWSEHCSYKHSRPILKLLPTKGPHVLQGPGENAGVIALDDGWALAFKMESHNHPSFIEPFQGAATGVGGILRDIFTMGARPVALLDSLRFGAPDHPKTRSLLTGVVSGIGFYGNCIGVPTVGGETFFDPAYDQNILVNVMCVGLMRQEDLVRGAAGVVGAAVYLVGARTGRDGIHGASLLASAEFREDDPDQRPSVQVGDPFLEKLLLEACLELRGSGALVGLQDLGAAGLTSSASEMAHRGGTGIELDVARVPRREEGMTPYEVMLSESQERMLAVVQPGREADVQAVFAKWGLTASEVGRVIAEPRFRVWDGPELVADLPVSLLADVPTCAVAPEPPEGWRPSSSPAPDAAPPRPLDAEAAGAWLLGLLSSPNIAHKAWIWRQYDHQVLAGTLVGPGSDAAVIRLRGTGGQAIALSADGNGRLVALDPFQGAAMAVAEAARNVVASGAEPVAITNCLNFGNPEKPLVAWQFEQAVRGIAAACQALGTPVTGGNVSFYNETGGRGILPTPIIGMVGKLARLEDRRTAGWVRPGDAVLLLGPHDDALSGSEWAHLYGTVWSGSPTIDLDLERRVQAVVLEGIRAGLIASAHDVSDGGLAVALVESCLLAEPGPLGLDAQFDFPEHLDPTGALFGESPSRFVVSCRPEAVDRLLELARLWNVPAARIGVTGGDRLRLSWRHGEAPAVALERPLANLESVWKEAIPRWLDA